MGNRKKCGDILKKHRGSSRGTSLSRPIISCFPSDTFGRKRARPSDGRSPVIATAHAAIREILLTSQSVILARKFFRTLCNAETRHNRYGSTAPVGRESPSCRRVVKANCIQCSG